MNIQTFNYDGKGATVTKQDVRQIGNSKSVERLKLNNGVIIVYTKTPNGFERLDTNYELIKQSNGYYYSDLKSPKKDFYDYY